MATILRLHLAVLTRDEETAGTTDDLRLLLDGDEIARFAVSQLPRGQTAILEEYVAIDYDSFADSQVDLALAGEDRWGPRSAFLWGYVPSASDSVTNYVPIAWNSHDRWHPAWISQNLNEGSDRWPLRTAKHMGWGDSLHSLVLIMEPAGALRQGLGDLLDLDRESLSEELIAARVRGILAGPTEGNGDPDAPSSSSGPATLAEPAPMELSLYSYVPGFHEVRDEFESIDVPEVPFHVDLSIGGWIRAVIFQTQLPRIGRQVPQYGAYFASFGTGKFMCKVCRSVSDACIRINSDTVWRPGRIYLFGTGGGNRARLLGFREAGGWTYSQDPDQLDPTWPAGSTVSLSHGASVLDGT